MKHLSKDLFRLLNPTQNNLDIITFTFCNCINITLIPHLKPASIPQMHQIVAVCLQRRFNEEKIVYNYQTLRQTMSSNRANSKRKQILKFIRSNDRNKFRTEQETKQIKIERERERFIYEWLKCLFWTTSNTIRLSVLTKPWPKSRGLRGIEHAKNSRVYHVGSGVHFRAWFIISLGLSRVPYDRVWPAF